MWLMLLHCAKMWRFVFPTVVVLPPGGGKMGIMWIGLRESDPENVGFLVLLLVSVPLNQHEKGTEPQEDTNPDDCQGS